MPTPTPHFAEADGLSAVMGNWSSLTWPAKELMKTIAGGALLAGRWAQRHAGVNVPGRCTVLYYHAIRASDCDRFARQMDLLARWTIPVSAGYQGRLLPGQRYTAVTFDDAFRCTVDNAIPILLDRGIPCTIFAPSSRLGRRPDWEMGPDHPDRNSPITSVKELMSLPIELVSIGSHTRTHPRLTSLSDVDARSELVGSRLDLENMLGREVDLFAFPHGEYDERILDLCREAGYRRVFSIKPGDTQFHPLEYAIPRILVNPHEFLLGFWVKLLGGYSWVNSLRLACKKRLNFTTGKPQDP